MGKYVRKKRSASAVASAPYEKKNPNKKKTNRFDEGEIVLVPDLKPNTLLKRVNKLKNEKGCTKKDAINEVWNKTPNGILIQAKVVSIDGDCVVVQYIKNTEGDVYKTKHTYHVGFVARPGTTGAGDTGEEDNEELNDGIANGPEKKKKKKKPIRKQLGWRHKSSQSNKKKQHTQKKKAVKDSDSDWDGSGADNTDDDDSINSDGGGSEVVSPKKKKADKKVSTSDGMQITKGTRFSYTFTVKNKPTTNTGRFVSVPNKKGGDYIVKYDGDSKVHTIPQSKLHKFKLLGSGGGGNVDSDEEEEKKQYTKPQKVKLNYSWKERKQQLKEFEVRYSSLILFRGEDKANYPEKDDKEEEEDMLPTDSEPDFGGNGGDDFGEDDDGVDDDDLSSDDASARSERDDASVISSFLRPDTRKVSMSPEDAALAALNCVSSKEGVKDLPDTDDEDDDDDASDEEDDNNDKVPLASQDVKDIASSTQKNNQNRQLYMNIREKASEQSSVDGINELRGDFYDHVKPWVAKHMSKLADSQLSVVKGLVDEFENTINEWEGVCDEHDIMFYTNQCRGIIEQARSKLAYQRGDEEE